MQSPIKFGALVLALATLASPALAQDRWHDQGYTGQANGQSWNQDNRGRGNDGRPNYYGGRNYNDPRNDRGDYSRGNGRREAYGDYRHAQPRRYEDGRNPYAGGGYYRGSPRWERGGRYYGSGYAPTYIVSAYDYGGYGLRQPPRGYYWRRDDVGNFLLVAAATGIIADLFMHGGY